MSNQEPYEEKSNYEKIITYVYVPDEGIYGTVVNHGAYASLIEYYENNLSYMLEVSNDEFIVIDEIGIGYLEETEDGL